MCGSCRSEVDLARAGMAALAGLPEIEPPGVSQAVLDVITARAAGVRMPALTPAPVSRRARRRSPAERGWRLVTGAGLAAAAVLAAVFLFFGSQTPKIASRGEGGQTGAAAPVPAASASPVISPPAGDRYDHTSLNGLAHGVASKLRSTPSWREFEPSRVPSLASPSAATLDSPSESEACLRRTGAVDSRAELRVLRSGVEYEGHPALVAAFLSPGEGAAKPYITVVAVSTGDCRLLYSVLVPE